MWRTRRASDQNRDRRIFPGHRLKGASALHNYLASIFTAPGVTTWSDMSGNTRKNQVTRLVTLRHRSIMSGALGLSDRASLTPRHESGRSGSPDTGPAANAVLTTAVDAWGRSWTPRCPSRSSGLIRRTVVDSRGRGHSPDNRKLDRRLSSRRAGRCRSLRIRGWASGSLPCSRGPRSGRRRRGY